MRPPGAAPDGTRLRALALAHLARFETTEVGLRRMLERAVGRWLRRALAEAGADPEAVGVAASRSGALIADVVRTVASQGMVDDGRFAERQAALDARRGRSARASQAALRVKGVPAALASEAARRSGAEEDAAALALLRRRRLGPFGAEGSFDAAGPLDAEGPFDAEGQDAAADAGDVRRRRALGMLARAGFGGDVARRTLALDREEAERILAAAWEQVGRS